MLSLFWNASDLPWASIGAIRVALINHPPVINVPQILVVNDVDCRNVSRIGGSVSPGISAESQQTLSVVVLSYAAAVREFEAPQSLFS